MTISKAVIDFSAFFNGDKKVIIKELSIMDVDSKCVQHWVLKSPKGRMDLPYSQVCRNAWLTRHYHGLEMNAGVMEYESLASALDYICDRFQFIFAATTEKARILEDTILGRRSVISLELLGCPPLSRDMIIRPKGQQCLMHHVFAPGFYCTLDNVKVLANWCSDNPQLIDINKPDIRVKTFRNWKCTKPSPRELADQGFIHCAADGDSTKCVYCNVSLFRWEEGDDVVHDHEYNSPNCKFINYLRQQGKGFTLLWSRTCADIPDSVPDCAQPLNEVTEEDLVDACRS